jgi:hypothetical protein
MHRFGYRVMIELGYLTTAEVEAIIGAPPPPPTTPSSASSPTPTAAARAYGAYAADISSSPSPTSTTSAPPVLDRRTTIAQTSAQVIPEKMSCTYQCRYVTLSHVLIDGFI